MTEHQRETAFLKRLVLAQDSEAHRQLHARLAQAEHDERVVSRAIALVTLLAAVSVAGLCYTAVLLPDFPHNRSQLVLRVFCVLGLGSLLCVLAFVGVWGRCRRVLNQLREECRQAVSAVLEGRFSGPRTIPFPSPGPAEAVPLYPGGATPSATSGVRLRQAGG